MAGPRALQPGVTYHVYNRGNNRGTVFFSPAHYRLFLGLLARHVTPAVDTLAYCLIPNHFHLLVRVRAESPLHPDPASASQGFSRLFNAYTKSVNASEGRTGSLFAKPFRRLPVTRNAHLFQLVIYIHRNPQRHHFARDYRQWVYSSYSALVASAPTRLCRDEVLSWYGCVSRFIDAHDEMVPGFDEP
jgi:REP element-mobilizing transposase RayT